MNNQLIRAVLADAENWEIVTFDNERKAPLALHRRHWLGEKTALCAATAWAGVLFHTELAARCLITQQVSAVVSGTRIQA